MVAMQPSLRRVGVGVGVVLGTDRAEAGEGESGIGLHQERRRGLRVRQARPVKMLSLRTGRYVSAVTVDVSVTGLRVRVLGAERAAMAGGAGESVRMGGSVRPVIGGAMGVGARVSVHVGLSEGGEPLANRKTMVPARVVWVSEGELGLELEQWQGGQQEVAGEMAA